MTFGFLAAAALLALAPRPGEMLSSCLNTVLPTSMAETQLDAHVRATIDTFIRVSPLLFDPQVQVAIYDARDGENARQGSDQIRSLLVVGGVDAGRIRVIEADEVNARYGPQPAGTLFLIAELSGEGSCADEISGADI